MSNAGGFEHIKSAIFTMLATDNQVGPRELRMTYTKEMIHKPTEQSKGPLSERLLQEAMEVTVWLERQSVAYKMLMQRVPKGEQVPMQCDESEVGNGRRKADGAGRLSGFAHGRVERRWTHHLTCLFIPIVNKTLHSIPTPFISPSHSTMPSHDHFAYNRPFLAYYFARLTLVPTPICRNRFHLLIYLHQVFFSDCFLLYCRCTYRTVSIPTTLTTSPAHGHQNE